MIHSLNLKAYGKINLGLDVLRRREDGYHEVRMIMQTVGIYDRIDLEQREEPGIEVETNLHYLPTNENNLVYKAAHLLMEEFSIKKGLRIKLKKFIPVAAGMAGGSSDAAAVLFGGFLGGLATVFLALAFASRLDGKMENQTVILVGMVFSLFVNAVLTMVTALSREHLQQMVFWQMGSFSGRGWSHAAVLFPVVLLSLLALQCFTREMDIMSFGEEQAMSMGVDLKRVKLLLMGLAALLTGTAVSLVGVIGFVDLIAPHVVRRIFGSSHRLVLPLSALFGGTFLMLAELISRTVMAPTVIPVGAVTALVGAPFFAAVYFRGRKMR